MIAHKLNGRMGNRGCGYEKCRVAPALKKGGKGLSFVYSFSPLVSTTTKQHWAAPIPPLCPPWHIPQAPPAPAAKAPFMILTKAAIS